MKIARYILASAIGVLLLAAGCQKANFSGGGLAEGEAQVSVNVTLPAAPATRSQEDPGDGTLANRCLMQVYLNDDHAAPTAYGDVYVADMKNLNASFAIRLASGHDYRLVFWSDCADGSAAAGFTDKYYITTNFAAGEVTMIDTELKGNVDERDAFFGETTVDKADFGRGTINVSAELKRPFGKLNISTTDYNQIPENSGLRPNYVGIDFKDLPNGINLLTGALLSSTADAGYITPVVVPANFSPAPDASLQLTYDYIFAVDGGAANDQQTVLPDFTMHFLSAEDKTAKVTDSYVFHNIPVRRNWETNVSGTLLTDPANVTVTIVPAFNPDPIVVVTDAASITEALESLGTGAGQQPTLQLSLTQDVTAPAAMNRIAKDTELVVDLNGNTLTLSDNVAASGTISLKNGKVSADNGTALMCLSNGSVELEDVVFKTEKASWGCIFINNNAENTSITIKDSEIQGGYYAVTSNATANPVASGTIVLENTTFTAAESALLINIPCTLTATKCTFTGGWQAAFVRGGDVTFTDCTLNLVMDPTYNDWPEKHNNADGTWKDGNQAETAVLLMGNRCKENATGYNYPTTVTLENTTFSISGSTNGGHTTTSVPAVSIWSRVEAGNGASFNYDTASETSFSAVGKGLVVNNNGQNLTINGSAYVAH